MANSPVPLTGSVELDSPEVGVCILTCLFSMPVQADAEKSDSNTLRNRTGGGGQVLQSHIIVMQGATPA